MTFITTALRRFVVDACDGPFGSAIASQHYVDEGARVIRLGNIGRAEWLDGDRAFIDVEYWRGLARHHANAGDLIVAALGDDRNPVGRAAVVPLIGRSLVKADCHRLRLDPSTTAAQFLAYYLSSGVGTYEAGRSSDGSTRRRLTIGKTLSLPVPDIRVELQRVIADFLDTETARIDALIAKKRRLMEIVAERFERRVFAGIAGRLTGDGEAQHESGLDWLGTVPSSWDVPPVGVNFDVLLGKMLNADAATGDEQFPYVRNTNVQWDRCDLDALATMHFGAVERRRFALQAGDLLVCEGGEVGRAAVWQASVGPVFFQKAIHRVRPRRDGSTRFLMYCLRAAAYREVFRVEGNQATIPHLTAEKLRVHRFPLPRRAEQDQIVQILDAYRDQAIATRERLTRQIALLQEHRQALITAAVTGELEVPGVAA